jgi:hypothetical protein
MEKEKTGLKYDELGPEAQARARAEYDPFVDWDWYSPHIEDFTDMMQEKFSIEVYDIEFGDDFGVWCQGRVYNSDIQNFLEAAVPEIMAKVNSPFHRMELGLDIGEDFFEDLSLYFTHLHARNPRAQAMYVELDGVPEDADGAIADEIAEKATSLMFRELVGLSVMLQKDWDWLQSEDAAIEDFRSNDVLFNPDGSRWE